MRRFHLQRVDSTNIEAQRLWVASPDDRSALIVRADTQTAGVGRQGSAWQSPGGGLWFSIARPAKQAAGEYAGLPLVVGLSIARVLGAFCNLGARIKWPNDVLVNERKIAGVLCSWSMDAPAAPLIVGVGVNGNYCAAALGSGLRQPATTIQDECRGRVDLDALFDRLVIAMADDLDQFDKSSLVPFLVAIRSRLAWTGDQVRLAGRSGDLLAAGRLVGIDERGLLIIADSESARRFADGELSRCEGNHRPTRP